MLPHDGTDAHALGPRRSDVVLVQHLEHSRAGQPRDPRGGEESQRHRRQHEVLESPATRGRQHIELDREDQDEHDPEPEGGHRLPEQRHDRGDVVDGRVPAHGGHHAGGNGQEQRDEERRSRQLEGRRQALEDERKGGLAVAHGLAEIAAEGAAEESPVLDDERIVEAHGLPEVPDVFGRGVRGQEQEGGIPRQVQDEEHHEGDAEQHEHRLGEPAEQVDDHAARRRRAMASMCGVCGNMSTGCTHSSR